MSRGREGYRRFLEWIFDEFDEPRAEIDEIIEAGDQVLVSFTLRGRGKQSGVAVDMSLFQLWTMREGKFARGQGFTSMDEARRLLGPPRDGRSCRTPRSFRPGGWRSAPSPAPWGPRSASRCPRAGTGSQPDRPGLR